MNDATVVVHSPLPDGSTYIVAIERFTSIASALASARVHKQFGDNYIQLSLPRNLSDADYVGLAALGASRN